MSLLTAIGTALGAAVIAGGTAASIYSATKGAAKTPTQPATTMPEPPKVTDAVKVAEEAKRDRMKAMARNKSVYTSPLGEEEEAKIARKTLLGQ